MSSMEQQKSGGETRKSSITRRPHMAVFQMTSQPEQLRDGRWNCSVPFWPDFRFHLICNRNKECALEEDERECPYNLCAEGGRFLYPQGYLNISSVSVSLCLCLFLSLSVCLYLIRLSVSHSESVCLPPPSMSLSLSLSVCLSVCLSLSLIIIIIIIIIIITIIVTMWI